MSETTNVMNSEVVKRLLCYVSYDTQSKDESSEVPSTQKQFDLAKVLKKSLRRLELWMYVLAITAMCTQRFRLT